MAIEAALVADKSSRQYIKIARTNAISLGLSASDAAALTASEVRTMAEAVDEKMFFCEPVQRAVVASLNHSERVAQLEEDRANIETAVRKLTGLSAATAEVDSDGNITIKAGK